MMLNVVVHAAEQKIVQSRSAEVAGGAEFLHEEGDRLVRFDDPGADVVDEKNRAEIGTSEQAHQPIIQERRRKTEHQDRRDEPQREMQEHDDLVDTGRARVLPQEPDAGDFQREGLQPHQNPDENRLMAADQLAQTGFLPGRLRVHAGGGGDGYGSNRNRRARSTAC